MPRYSYICTNCENHLEAFHSSDERLSFCEQCQTDSLKKVLSIPTIIKKNDIKEKRKINREKTLNNK
mgnify:CR=1 FL=1